MTAPRAIFLKVTLLEIQPAIWRRFAVPAGITLPGLHRVLQAAMGWEDYHLHSFSFGDVTYGPTDPDWPSAMIEERGKRLRKLLDESGGEFTYEYDFGDGWTHRVEVADPFETKSRLPVCFDGARACPPEDCGGPWGYESFLEAIGDPKHDEHSAYLEWVGGAFDPDAFDVTKANALLRLLAS